MPEQRFEQFAERKMREAERATIHPLITIAEPPIAHALKTIGNAWTERQYDGRFHLIDTPSDVPAISLVFVQSREGNTAADNPDELGGGATDKHLIYEGLSRVAADAVLAGASTVAGDDIFFSVWHPELVALRRDLALPRHPTQIVVSQNGRVDLDNCLLFNVPDVPVIILAGDECRNRCQQRLTTRSWISVVPIEPAGMRAALARVRAEHGVTRISAIGGRATASSLIDGDLVQDLMLTTTAKSAGQPNTPYYIGDRPPAFDAIVKKRATDPEHPIVFEHLALQARTATDPAQ